MIKLASYLWVIFLIGCASGPSTPPGQLATRDMETRDMRISYDAAYKAVSNAFFAMGYTIKHSDKASGIIVGSRSDPGTGKKAAMILLFGVPGALIDTKTNYEITVMLTQKDKEFTTIRIGTSVNGQPVVCREIIDSIWTVVEREAMIDEPVKIRKKEESQTKESARQKEPTGEAKERQKPTME
ncbi:MAG: hypothetical protein QXT73_04795 [Candidatus Methanomethylicaceae archaeon]